MNSVLTEQIVYHIFSSFCILPSNFVDASVTKSLLDKRFMIDRTIKFDLDNRSVDRHVYGIQITPSEGKELKILVGDCSQEASMLEYCLIIHLEDSPTYGAYLIHDEHGNHEALIAASVDGKNWMPCNTYLQATFLAGMERLRDLGLGWDLCKNYEPEYQSLLSFIDFHIMMYGGSDEGEEV